ncbi:MAG TPA: peptidoglycan editing factor PgeF, partial [Burkholderiales bacterium]|nr:peptidoglycan editing factor PgeF [Burkholderiales bacterium]
MSVDPGWIVPQWPAPANVRALITTRAGGVSTGAYASFNLGTSTADDPAAVSQNRARLRGLLPREPLWLRQVHGNRVVNADHAAALPIADASVAFTAGPVCAILVADCIPVLVTDRSGSVIAAAHAGWRGLASGVVPRTIEAMCARGTRAADLIAYLGPGIGRTAFEVGADVVDAFTAHDGDAAGAFVRHGADKWLCDLFWLARRSLAQAGVREVYGEDLCTYSDPGRFYSYRRD